MRSAPIATRSRHAARRVAAVLLLLAAFTTACGGGGATGPSDTPDHGGPTRVPEVLVGAWYVGAVGNTNYYDPATGSWSSPSGNGESWRFTADGHFAHAQLLQQSFYGCTTRIFYYDAGTVTATEARIDFRSESATIKSEDSCNAQWNYERAATGTTAAVDYVLGSQDGRPTLSLQWSNGPASYHK